jgi:GT2 family glycosyltransferase
VVVPTLGRRPDYITRTFDSLDDQDGVTLNVVVVAPRGASHVMAECARRRYIYLEQRGNGMSNAINQGWRTHGESSEFWGWLGDDDELLPNSLITAAAHLRRSPRASMVYGRCRYVDLDGHVLFEARPGRFAAHLLRWGPDLVPQPGSLARGSAIRAAGLLDESLSYAMDLDLFLRLKEQGPLGYERTALATFRWHVGSTTVSGLKASEAEAATVRRRTWVGRRRVGYVIEPFATLSGRVLHRLQKYRLGSLPG